MSKQATAGVAAAADEKGCGCGGHAKHVQRAELPTTNAKVQPSVSTHNKDARLDHSMDRSPCCCGGKAVTETRGSGT